MKQETEDKLYDAYEQALFAYWHANGLEQERLTFFHLQTFSDFLCSYKEERDAERK